MANTSALEMAASFDEEIAGEGQLVSIYAPITTVTSGNPAQGPVALAGTTSALFEFGQSARDAAYVIGIDPIQAAIVYILSKDAGLLTEGSWIKDTHGRAWWVRGRPDAQELEGVVIGCNAVVTFTPEKPNGMP